MKLNKIYYTYFLINSLDDKIFYVGKGKGRRMYVHVKKSLRKRHKNKKLQNKIRSIFRKHGKILYAKVKENLTEKQAYGLEKIWVRKLGRENLCNLTDGGEGNLGGIIWNKGKKLSEKHKRKLSLSHKGHYTSIETKRKLSLAGIKRHKKFISPMYGKYHTEKTKRKMSLSHQKRKKKFGYTNSLEARRNMRIGWIKRRKKLNKIRSI
jgi:hypothetical protein